MTKIVHFDRAPPSVHAAQPRVRDMATGDGRVFVGCGTEEPEYGGADPEKDFRERPGGEQRTFGHVELVPGDLHVVERLLDEGGDAGFRRLVQGDMLALPQQVPQDGQFGFPADEVLAGDVFVIDERSVHGSEFLCSNAKIGKYLAESEKIPNFAG